MTVTDVAALAAQSDTGTVADLVLGLEHQAGNSPSPRAVAFPTGFDPLDNVLSGGVRAHDLALIGGMPGVGKTIAALQWARHMAIRGDNAIYACYEHDASTLLARLFCLELAESLSPEDITRTEALRAIAHDVAMGHRPLRDAVAAEPSFASARDRMDRYSERLWLLRVSGSRTGLTELSDLVAQRRGERTALFVDYLQKVSIRPEPADEKVLRITEGLKDLALTTDVAVIAVVAADIHAWPIDGSGCTTCEVPPRLPTNVMSP